MCIIIALTKSKRENVKRNQNSLVLIIYSTLWRKISFWNSVGKIFCLTQKYQKETYYNWI